MTSHNGSSAVEAPQEKKQRLTPDQSAQVKCKTEGCGGNMRESSRYRRYQTPLETLLALPQPQQHLRPGLTLDTLKRIGKTMSDTEAAQRMQQAKRRLFAQFKTA